MHYLLDTNLLIRIVNPVDSQFRVARSAVHTLFKRRDRVVLVPQVIYECWVVLTRRITSNGLGYSPRNAVRLISKWRNALTFIDDQPGIQEIWFDLVERNSISGKPAHDARLVAAMINHKIDRLLTFNDADFKRFAEITAESPLALLSP